MNPSWVHNGSNGGTKRLLILHFPFQTPQSEKQTSPLADFNGCNKNIVNVITILTLPESHYSNDNRHSMSK